MTVRVRVRITVRVGVRITVRVEVRITVKVGVRARVRVGVGFRLGLGSRLGLKLGPTILRTGHGLQSPTTIHIGGGQGWPVGIRAKLMLQIDVNRLQQLLKRLHG